jgi:glutathione peroxidase
MIFRFVIILLFAQIHGGAMASETATKTAHGFVFKSIEGEHLPLSSFSGKAVLIVNTASHCGFTRQYDALQDLWQRFQSQGLVVLGVPSDDFGGQEPGTEDEIKTFCEVNFDVDFPLTEKVQVKGTVAHPFYRWAAGKFGMAAKPRWNFHKYLITPDGQLADWFSTPTSPVSARVIKAVEQVLPR